MKLGGMRSRSTIAVALLATATFVHGASAVATILEGYPTESSIVQGGVLELHVRSDAPTYAVSVWCQRQQLEHVADIGSFPGQNFTVPDSAWEYDCGWPVTCRVAVQTQWRAGLYLARLDAANKRAFVPFVVRATVPASCGPILVQIPLATWQAYNRYAGKSLYVSLIPSNPGRAYRVTFHRPYNYFDVDGRGQLSLWDGPLLSYLESQGYAYEVCTSVDLHRNPDLLTPYKLFVSSGHDEYWSKEQYDEVERFVAAGGNVAFLGANILWWQVRYEDQEHTLVCYKSSALDPLTGIDNARVTVNWHSAPVLRPPARLMGVYYNGSSGITAGPYQVVNPHHWVFTGVSADSGQSFGDPMVGFEVDGRDGDSPKKMDIIAHTERPDIPDNVNRPADMVYYERTPAYGFPNGSGAKIFATGTCNFVQGLLTSYNGWTRTVGRPDPLALAIARNVLDRLGCSLHGLRLGRPADGSIVRTPRVLLQWHPAQGQRPEIPVCYTLYWSAGPARVDSVACANLSAWVPISPESSYHWWVRAASECGASQISSAWTFHAQAPTDAANPARRPLLTVERLPGCVSVIIAPERQSRGWLRIVDAKGRVVQAYENRVFNPPETRIDWTMRDRGGLPVASGVYFVQARVGSRTAQDRVFVIH